MRVLKVEVVLWAICKSFRNKLQQGGEKQTWGMQEVELSRGLID